MEDIVLLTPSGFRYVKLDDVIKQIKRVTRMEEDEIFINLLEPELKAETVNDPINGAWVAEQVCTFMFSAAGFDLVVPFYIWEDAIEFVKSDLGETV